MGSNGPTSHGGSRWFPEGDSAKELGPVKDTVKDFRRNLKTLGKQFTQDLNKACSQVFHGTSRAESGADFEAILGDMSLPQLQECVDQQLASLKDEKAQLSERRNKGWRKATAWLLPFAETFSEFLKAYSGIVTIFNAVDSQYGNVATAALSLLFAVFQHKALNEKALQSCLEQIRDRLPEMEIYDRVYPDKRLSGLLAEVYRDVVRFAQEATSYCLSSRERLAHTLGTPRTFQTIESGMRDRLTNVRRRCEALLAEKVDLLSGNVATLVSQNKNLDKQVSDLKTQISELQSETEGLRSSKDEDDMNHIKEILGNYAGNDLDRDAADSKLREQHGILRDVTTGSPKWEQIHHTDLMKTEKDFEDWCTSRKSSMLVLSGHNGSKVHSQNSWLSPIVVETIQLLMKEEQVVAYQFCRSTGSARAALSSLICQLLERDRGLLRRCTVLTVLENSFNRSQAIEDDQQDLEDAQVTTLKSALVAVVDASSEPVHIVLDRPELLGEENDAESIMDAMLEIVKQVRPEQLKVLMCIDMGRWKVEKWIKRPSNKSEALSYIRRDQNPR